MKKILYEPLLHFLLLGAAIFVAYGLVSKRISDEPGKIVISQGQIASIVVGFTRTWQRPPTSEELEGLIRDRVREEVYCREALALGLDKDDIIICRRLRQKMEFVTDDVVARAQPTDEELNAYLQAHPDPFRVQRQCTFSQVYLNPEKHGENLARDTAQLLAQLNQAGGKADVSALGDSFLLEHTFAAAPGSEIAKQFGEKFAAQLDELAPGQWQGPVESGYGVHLVFVSERTEGRLPALAEVRDAVCREWVNARRLEANEKLYKAMLKRYVVTIERPQVEEEKKFVEAKVK
jgi:parvulin-like peptidyl-prolyl cis-trans isomerase-like protein